MIRSRSNQGMPILVKGRNISLILRLRQLPPDKSNPLRRLPREAYTVGWIAALAVELTAAHQALDELHAVPSGIPARDVNAYTCGRIGKHNVVMAVLPSRQYGTESAAMVATHLLRTFTNIRIGLMVGIAGGVLSKEHDVRLGDVVVGCTRNNTGGIQRYDVGTSLPNGEYIESRVLQKPPAALRDAVSALQTWHTRHPPDLEGYVNNVLLQQPQLREEYGRPPSSPRVPVIHHGVIASGNCVVKDAVYRDKIAARMGALCFEMEAGGLMKHFPCLTIRGISDYADKTKNNEWQGFASMVAVAYAVKLLEWVPTVDGEEDRDGDGDGEGSIALLESEHPNVMNEIGVRAQSIESAKLESGGRSNTLPETPGSVDRSTAWRSSRMITWVRSPGKSLLKMKEKIG